MPRLKPYAIYMTNWTNLGTTVPVTQWTVDIVTDYWDENGVLQHYEATHTFPDDLTAAPLWLRRRIMEELLPRLLYRQLGLEVDVE